MAGIDEKWLDCGIYQSILFAWIKFLSTTFLEFSSIEKRTNLMRESAVNKYEYIYIL